jgi:hypothetical protein
MFGARELQAGQFIFNLNRAAGSGRRVLAGEALIASRTRGGGRDAFLRVDLGLAESKIIGDRFVIVQAEVLGVGANESFIEDAAGKQIEVLLLDSLQHARADFGGLGNFFERDVLGLARFAEFVAELAHGSFWVLTETS